MFGVEFKKVTMSSSSGHKCQYCERLRLAAIEASRTYHGLQAELESAHISHEDERILDLRRQVDQALLNRDAALGELCAHEAHDHAKAAGA